MSSARPSPAHGEWPPRTGVLWIASNEGEHIDSTKHPRFKDLNNELLGSHGDDTVGGGSGHDVIWGDHIPRGPGDQHDVLTGGAGNDFIYGSHGHNEINIGPGKDVVHVLFGRGTVTCGRPRDRVYVSHRNRAKYTFHGRKRLIYH